ncbi:MAG: cytochrome P450 [Rhodoluna sp.]|nr:cytochrome P450 [Rhodoluna sp.]
MIDFDDAAFIENPYPALAELRKAGKPVWHEPTGSFLAARYEDANAVLRNRSLGRIFKPRTPEQDWSTFNWLHSDSLLDSEPPKHTRLRSLLVKAFSKNKIDSLRPDVDRLTKKLLDDIELKLNETGQFDVIGDLAEPLPVKVIAALLGFPDEDEHLLRPWSQAIVKMYELNPSPEAQAQAQLASHEFAEYVRGLMEERKRNPGTDLISDLAAVEEDGEKLNAQELIATCVLLLNAGHEASVNGFGNGFVAMMHRPEQLALLAKNPYELAASAVDEFIRFDAPLHLFERTATADVEIGGVLVEEGQKIAALLGSANRDETVFDRPTEMDVTRDPNPHIGFGAGIHFCIGAPLARMEMSVSLPALMAKYPNLELAAEPVRRPGFVLRGYESVQLKVN